MEALERTNFERLFLKGIQRAIDDAQHYISDPLPGQVCFELANFGQSRKTLSFDEIVPFLYKDGYFPQIVDIAVKGIRNEQTLIWVRASDHPFVRDLAQTWNTPPGMGPFKSIGLLFPYDLWKHPRTISVQELKEMS